MLKVLPMALTILINFPISMKWALYIPRPYSKEMRLSPQNKVQINKKNF